MVLGVFQSYLYLRLNGLMCISELSLLEVEWF